MIPKDRRIELAVSSPRASAIVHHDIEEVERCLQMNQVVSISPPGRHVDGEDIGGVCRAESCHQLHKETTIRRGCRKLPIEVDAVVVVLRSESDKVLDQDGNTAAVFNPGKVAAG